MTVIYVPQDSRPTSFSYSFENSHGVKIDVTVNTRDEGIAQKVADDLVGTLKWTRVSRKDMPTWAVPFAAALMLALLGALVWFGCIILDMGGMMPRLGFYETFDAIECVMKWYVRGAIVSWIPLSAIAMWANEKGLL